jgi:cytochrome c oxidase subunit III
MRMLRPTLDVSDLPTFSFGNRGLVYWGTLGFMVIEGFSLALCMATYLYLRQNADSWPPPHTPLPDLLWPTIGLVVVLLSLIPMFMVYRSAVRLDRAATARWLIVASVMGVLWLALRAVDFAALNTRWDSNAYGSAAWAIVGTHALLVVLEVGETLGGMMLMLVGRVQEKHFVDATDNAMYWCFVVLAWVPSYVAVYVLPRWI